MLFVDHCVVDAQKRVNQINVQQLSDIIYDQVFPSASRKNTEVPEELVQLSKKHLTTHELLGKNSDNSEPIGFKVPPLRGSDIAEHFYQLGSDIANPYLKMAKKFANSDLKPLDILQTKLKKDWVGWVRYTEDTEPEKVDFPLEDCLVFDVEVLYKVSPYPVMACAASPEAWYVWISPWLLDPDAPMEQLIPLRDSDERSQHKVVVGHNIGYDRARIKDEYHLEQTNTAFLDTMSLHVATHGMCSRQRPAWMKHRKTKELREKYAADHTHIAADLAQLTLQEEADEAWITKSSINSLKDVAEFHLEKVMSKEVRDLFGTLDRAGVVDKLPELIQYCATDVEITHKVYQKVLPGFLRVCPHPVSFGALRHLSSVTLPVNESWETYINTAEEKFQRLSSEVMNSLVELANKAVSDCPLVPSASNVASDGTGKRSYEQVMQEVNADPWLSQLDWTIEEQRRLKGNIKKGLEERDDPRQKLPGYPKWFKDICSKPEPGKKPEPVITVRSRIAALLLRLSWDNNPLVWSNEYGWTFKIPARIDNATNKKIAEYIDKNYTKCDFSGENKQLDLRDDRDHVYFKLPHKDGASARCVNPMSKNYMKFFEEGTLSSEHSIARSALEMNAACSYWISARERIMNQMVVWSNTNENMGLDLDSVTDNVAEIPGVTTTPIQKLGIILPQLIPMGTITRRAVEKTWLTASNAKKNRVGSELKAMVRAPPGYSFVGADVE